MVHVVLTILNYIYSINYFILIQLQELLDSESKMNSINTEIFDDVYKKL